MDELRCRFCDSELTTTFVDLGASPLANSYLEEDDLHQAEIFYPLHVFRCDHCYLVQLPEAEHPEEIFSNYAYFSSYSESWLRHAETYVASMMERFDFDASSQVVEVASNDGYLLQYFQHHQVPVLGIEPASNVARVAEEKGIETRVAFFGRELAQSLADEGRQADLVVGNNVLAHVPALNDFVAGLNILLKSTGVLTMEFPHLLRLMEEGQFDTIYHEHYSYFSFFTVRDLFAAHDLRVWDVEELPSHGGSLRIFVCHEGNQARQTTHRVDDLLAEEEKAGLMKPEAYEKFAERVHQMKRAILSMLIDIADRGEKVAGYGAPAKGNTLLNYCGIGPELLPYTVDLSPHKQGRYLPGTRIPIHAPERIVEDRPDWVWILPWNLKKEIARQMSEVKSWGGRFIVAVPRLNTVE